MLILQYDKTRKGDTPTQACLPLMFISFYNGFIATKPERSRTYGMKNGRRSHFKAV